MSDTATTLLLVVAAWGGCWLLWWVYHHTRLRGWLSKLDNAFWEGFFRWRR